MPTIEAADLGLPPDSPINLTNEELAQRLQDLLPALPPLYIPLVTEAAQRLLDMGGLVVDHLGSVERHGQLTACHGLGHRIVSVRCPELLGGRVQVMGDRSLWYAQDDGHLG